MSEQNTIETTIVDLCSDATIMHLEYIRAEKLSDDTKQAIILENRRRAINPNILFENNVKNQKKVIGLQQLIQAMIKHQAICTGYGSWFKNHHTFDSSICRLLKALGEGRGVARGIKTDLLAQGIPATDIRVKAKDKEQLIWKLLANSFYGAYSEERFIFFSKDMGPSITYTGRMMIGHQLYVLETLLADNHFFTTPEDVMSFVAGCMRTYVNHSHELEALGENPYADECTYDNIYNKIVNYCHPNDTSWNPEIVVKDVLDCIPEDALPCIFYRGHITKFLEFSNIKSELIEKLSQYAVKESDYKWIKQHTPDIYEFIETLWRYAKNWVAMPTLTIDNIEERVLTMHRRVVILTDTDSCFIGLSPLVEWCNKGLGLDIKNPDNKISHVNFFIIFLRLVSDAQMQIFAEKLGVPEEHRHLLNFKSEYFYERLILTNGKKNYIGLKLFQDGAKLVNEKWGFGELDIKGLQIKKSGTAKGTGKFHMDSIEKYILRSPEMNRMGLLDELTLFEQDILIKTRNGSLDFVKPSRYKNPASYKNPAGMPNVRGVTVWNELYPDNPVLPSETALLCKISVLNNYDAFIDLLEDYDGDDKDHIIEVITKIFFSEDSDPDFASKGFNWFAMPYSTTEVPKWVRPLINVKEEIQANVAPVLPILASLDIKVTSASPSNFTNILKL